MESRKWEDLSRDCLVKVFEGVGLESLLLDLHFVCKSWYKASLDPQCWKHIDFHFLVDKSEPSFIDRVTKCYGINNFSDIKFIQYVGYRSCRSAASLVLPFYFTEDTLLECLADEFSEVKHLQITDHTASAAKYDYFSHYVLAYLKFTNGSPTTSNFVCKFKHLEELTLVRSSSRLEETLNGITLHCQNLVSFCTKGYITEEDAVAIITHVPKIKTLSLKGCVLTRKELLIILKGCGELECLNISHCVGFDIDDEVLKCASHIRAFFFEGSRNDGNELKQFHSVCGLSDVVSVWRNLDV